MQLPYCHTAGVHLRSRRYNQCAALAFKSNFLQLGGFLECAGVNHGDLAGDIFSVNAICTIFM